MNIFQSNLIVSALINALPFIIISFPFISACYILIHVIDRRHPKFVDSVFIIGVMFSIVFVLSITVLTDSNIEEFRLSNLFDEYQLNIIPLNTIKEYYFMAMGGNINAIINLFGNIAIFIPIGFFISGKIRNKANIKTVAICFFISFFIEISQALFSRYGDIDDIIINTVGGYLGCLLFNYLNVIFSISDKLYKIKHKRKQLLLIIIVLIVVWLIFIILDFCIYSNIRSSLISLYS